MRHIFRDISITLCSSGIFFVVNFLASVILQPASYGELSASVNTITLVGVLISSGISFYIVSIGSENNLQASFDFALRFFIVSCFFSLISLFIYWKINNGRTVETVLYAYPAAASIGFCLVIVGYFQLAGNYTISAAMSSIPNLVKSVVLLYALVPFFEVIDTAYPYRAVGILLHLVLLCSLILIAYQYRDKNLSRPLQHKIPLAAKFVVSNLLVSAYTSMVIPIVFLTYGADHSAIFSIFFIFWSLLNIVTGYLYGNFYLIKLKLIFLRNDSVRDFFYKVIQLGMFIGFFITISSIAIFKFGSFNFWSKYAVHQAIIISLLCTLGLRSISAAAGLFLSLGDWVKWKNVAQFIFITTLYFPIVYGASFEVFVAAYLLAEFALMTIYFLMAYIRVNTPSRPDCA